MSKPSILMINRVYPPAFGATGRMMRDLAQALANEGWDVTILSAVRGRAEPSRSDNITHEYIERGMMARGYISYTLIWVKLYLKALRLKRHDVVLTMTDPPMCMMLGRYVASVKQSKHVHWVQDMYPDLLPALKAKVPKFIAKFMNDKAIKSYNNADHIVAIGNCIAKRLKDKKGVPEYKLSCIPNWADFEVIEPSASGDNKVQNKIPEKIERAAKKPEEMFRDNAPKFRVLYAGNIGRAHPAKLIIEAATLLAEHKEIEFVFVGDHHAHSVLAKERDKRGLENIKFMPFQPIEKLRGLMESGDVHLVTMRDEAQGMLVPCKFYSGMAVGRPTIFAGPKNCEVANVINKYNAGAVVSSKDGEALAEAIYKYRHDGDLWFAGQQGALAAAQEFHPNKSLEKWVDVLNTLEGRSR